MSQIGRYNIVRQTGSHGIAALYEAFDPIMKRSVNICLAEHPTDPDAAGDGGGAPVLVDSRRVSSLEHPNIVKVLAWDEDQDRPYMVMEQFEGRPLSELLAERATLPAEEVAGILKHAAAGLDHAHSNGLIHRNLTAASLLVSEDGDLKIAGFEMARQQGADQVLENPEALIGSIAYLAPEFLTGDAVDPRSDQFSLAVIAFEALTGQLPFRAEAPAARLKQVAFGSPEMAAAADLPAAAVRVLEKGLSKTPAARYSSCGEYAAAFEAAIAVKAPSAPTRIATPMPGSESSLSYSESPPSYSESPLSYMAPASSGPSRVTLLIAIAVAAVVAVAAVFYLMSPSMPPPAASKSQPPVAQPGPATAPGKTPAVAAPKAAAKAPPVAAKPAPKTDQPPVVAGPPPAKKKAAPKAAPPPPEPEPEPKAPPKFRPVEPKVVQP